MSTPQITESEFEEEVLRVLMAFEIKLKMPPEINYRLSKGARSGVPWHDAPRERWTFNTQNDTFELHITRYKARTTDRLYIQAKDADATDSIRFTNFFVPVVGQMLECLGGRHPKCCFLMVQALFRLGYDIEPLCNGADIAITAHEKLHLYLETQEKPSAILKNQDT